MQVLKLICWYAVLAPSGSEQITLLNTTAQVSAVCKAAQASLLPACSSCCWYVWRHGCLLTAPTSAQQDKRLEELPLYDDLLQSFITKEVGLQNISGVTNCRPAACCGLNLWCTPRVVCDLLDQTSRCLALADVGELVVHSQRKVHSGDAGAARRLWRGVWRAGAHRLQVCMPAGSPWRSLVRCTRPAPSCSVPTCSHRHSSTCPGAALRSVCKIGLAACRLRVTEHNILVVAKYYSRIRMERLAMLLDLPAADSEKHLSDMVVAGHVTAKIDRPAGVRPPLRDLSCPAASLSSTVASGTSRCTGLWKKLKVGVS